VAAVAFAVGFAAFPLRVVGARGDHLPGDPADNRLNNFVLEHGHRYLRGRVDSFWDAPMFYPARRATAWSDAHLGMLPVYSALRVAGLSPEGAFQGQFLIAFVLNFASAAWALRRLGFGPAGAAAGAYVFTFGLPLVAQLTHVQLYPRFLVPVAAAFAWEFLCRPRTWRLGAVAAAAVGQAYLTIYIAYFLALLLGTGLAVAAVRYRRQLPWGELVRCGRGVWVRRVAVVAAAGVALLPLVAAHGGTGGPPAHLARSLAPEPGWWVTPPRLSAFAELAGSERPIVGEHQLFPGFIPLIAVGLGLAAVVRSERVGGPVSAAAVAAWSALLLAVVVTPLGGVWLYEPVNHLRGVGGIRAVGRVVLVLLFPAAVAVAWFADMLIRAARRGGRLPAALAAAFAVGAVAADQWLTPTDGARAAHWHPARYRVETALARQERIAQAIRRHPNPTLVYAFPSAGAGSQGGALGVQFEAMRASQDAGLPCVNGWSGYLPPAWDFFADYRSLLEWLARNDIPAEVLAGLVVVGEPVPDRDPRYDASMRARFPPQPMAPGP
jgi:hypothetical protein